MRRRSLLVAALWFLAALGSQPLRASDAATLFAQPPASASLTLAFEERAVVVSGLLPGAPVAWVSLSSVPQTYYSRLVRREGLDPAGTDGTLRIELEEAVAPKSVWAAVELASGRVALAAPAGFELRTPDFPGGGLAPGSVGQLNRFAADREELDFLSVRPGVGAWGLHAGDGGATDGDGEENGSLLASLDEARPLGDSPPAPPHLLPGDVLIVLDPRTLEVYAARLAGAPAQP